MTMIAIAILLLIVAALVLFAVREGFAATATIKNPNSWNAEEYARIKALVPGSAFTDAEIQDVVGGMWSVWTDATRPITLGQIVNYMDRKPEYASRKTAFVNLLKAYYIDQFDYQFAGGHAEVPTTEETPETPATGSEAAAGAGQAAAAVAAAVAGGGTAGAGGSPGGSAQLQCPAGSAAYALYTRGPEYHGVKCVEQRLVYDGVWPQGDATTKPCELDLALVGRTPGTTAGNPKCIRYTGVPELEIMVTGGRTSAGGVSGTSVSSTVATTAAMTGTTTGGSSTSSLGPTNIPAGTKGARVVYGPEWKGLGEGGGLSGGDSTSTRSYPVLLGPEPVASTRIDGVGVIAPSQNYLLGVSGSLPSAGSLGATEMSGFFPYSRVANTELSVDPWRVASAFSTSSYSQKTDPVPFLADFSAFQR